MIYLMFIFLFVIRSLSNNKIVSTKTHFFHKNDDGSKNLQFTT